MSPALPVVSGKQAISVLEKIGYEVSRQRGSHVRMRHADAAEFPPLTVPMHKELDTGLLRALIRQAGLSPDEFTALL